MSLLIFQFSPFGLGMMKSSFLLILLCSEGGSISLLQGGDQDLCMIIYYQENQSVMREFALKTGLI